MQSIGKGLLAALAATVVLSIIMVLKGTAGLLPDLSIPKMLAMVAGAHGLPAVGWLIHSVIGIVIYGIAMPTLGTHMPGPSSTMHGLALAVIGWLIMMIVLMPMAGAGLFGIVKGPMAALVTFVLHMIFGAVLGWTYGRLIGSEPMLAARAR